MERKARIEMDTIAIAVIVLVAIVVIIFIFRNQIGNLSKGYTSVSDKQIQAASGDQCETFLTNRRCASQAPEQSGWTIVTAPPGGWSDCGAGKTKDGSCWEKS